MEVKKITQQELRKERQKFVEKVIGARDYCVKGTFSFILPDKIVSFNSSNCTKLLNTVLFNLQRDRPHNMKEQLILNSFGKNFLEWEEILSLKIKFEPSFSNFNPDPYLINVPAKGGGVYIIKFPNSKSYIGSSSTLKKKLREHLISIFTLEEKQYQWHYAAVQENSDLQPQDLEIKVIVGKGVKSLEKKLLQDIEVKDRPHYYNQKF